jgi:hypothetical protein
MVPGKAGDGFKLENAQDGLFLVLAGFLRKFLETAVPNLHLVVKIPVPGNEDQVPTRFTGLGSKVPESAHDLGEGRFAGRGILLKAGNVLKPEKLGVGKAREILDGRFRYFGLDGRLFGGRGSFNDALTRRAGKQGKEVEKRNS